MGGVLMADMEATSHGFTKKESPIMTKLHLIPFLNNSTLQSVEYKKQRWVALRPICEDLGIDIDSQRKKLKEQQRWTCGDITVRDSVGRKQVMTCILVDHIAGWLFSINPSKVSENVRDKLMAYQDECHKALTDYWTIGYAAKEGAKRQLSACRSIALDALKENAPDIYGREASHFDYSNLNRAINQVLTAKWAGLDHENLTPEQLTMLAKVAAQAAVFLNLKMPIASLERALWWRFNPHLPALDDYKKEQKKAGRELTAA